MGRSMDIIRRAFGIQRSKSAEEAGAKGGSTLAEWSDLAEFYGLRSDTPEAPFRIDLLHLPQGSLRVHREAAVQADAAGV